MVSDVRNNHRRCGVLIYDTQRSPESLRESYNVGVTILDLIKNDAIYHDDFSNVRGSMWFCRVPWGITEDLIIDKNIGEKDNPITQENVQELNETIYKIVYKNFKNKKIKFDKQKSGTIVLSFIIDYKELIDSFALLSNVCL